MIQYIFCCFLVLSLGNSLSRISYTPLHILQNVRIFGYSRKQLTDEDLRTIIVGTLTCRVDHQYDQLHLLKLILFMLMIEFPLYVIISFLILEIEEYGFASRGSPVCNYLIAT